MLNVRQDQGWKFFVDHRVAKEFLRNRRFTVGEVAEATGFADQSHVHEGLLQDGWSHRGTVSRVTGLPCVRMKLSAVDYTPSDLAARETAKLSSNIWKRVILPSATLRISANGDSIIFPVALTFEARSPKITARSSSAKIP